MRVFLEQIVPPLKAVIGKKLKHIWYYCIETECEPDELADPLLYISADVELQFANDEKVFVVWEQNAGGLDGISIPVKAHYSEGHWERVCADDAPLWQPLIGEVLQKVELFGMDGVVSVVCFSFDAGCAFIAEGWGPENLVGGGDDTLIRAEKDFWQAQNADMLKVIWARDKKS